jgi:hypothetical protein
MIACLDLIGNSAVTIRDYGTTVHKRKLVLELMQGGFPTNRPPKWLALYGYLHFAGLPGLDLHVDRRCLCHLLPCEGLQEGGGGLS